MPLALFGIENDGLNLVANLLVLFIVVVYFALVVWTYTDAKRRISDPLLVGCATAASLFPFFGTIVYLILRPPEFLEDAHERELEVAAAEARLMQLSELACPHCHHPIEKAYLRCPNCHRRLKEPCVSCGKALDPRWRICPYCEHEVGQPAPQRRRQRAAQPRAAGGEPAPRAARSQTRAARAPDGAASEQEPAPTRTRPPAS